MGVGPNLEQVDLATQAANVAEAGRNFFEMMGGFLTSVQNSSQVSGIATADWTSAGSPQAPAPLQGIGSSDFANLVASFSAVAGLTATTPSGASVTVGQAFEEWAERAPQT